MTEPVAHPTRLLKLVALFARWSLGLLLAFSLLLAIAWGVLHGWIVPRIGEYRALIEARAEQALGVPVRLGSITARTEGVIPTFELGDVALLDAQGREALRLKQVVVALSPRSLLNLEFEQLFIQGPEVDVRRTPDGHIWVAGLDLSAAGEGSGAADWLFSQPEVVVRGGRVRWTDELRGAPPLSLDNVEVLLRNGNWRHAARIDATPPTGFGERFTLMARMREPLLSVHSGRWHQWSGQVYGTFPKVDVSQLGRHVDLGQVALTQGTGALRAWLDVERGQVRGGVADLAVAQLDLRLAPELEPLVLHGVEGRVGGRRDAAGFQVFTRGLRFVSEDGNWPGGNLRLSYQQAQPGAVARGQFDADQLDLAALARIAERLPFSKEVHAQLHHYAPRGLVERIAARWQGEIEAPASYEARGRVSALALAATPAAGDALAPDEPAPAGVRGLDVDFDLTQQGGKAALQMAGGALVLPSVFEDATLPLDTLHADVTWKVAGDRISVEVPRAQFANADAAGEARASWHTSDPATSSSKARFPGVLDLRGQLTRADGTRVHRYLPLAVPAAARHYVRDAVQAGRATSVSFKVRGDLHDMPFNDPRQGDFRIAAHVNGVTYAYVPPQLQTAGEPPWPALVKLSGELIFERAGMQVKGAIGGFAGRPGIEARNVEASIPDFSHSVVNVAADARGPLAQLLGFVAASPLAQMTGGALAQASGTGNGQLQLHLQLPISELHTSKVQGNLQLAGNDVRITPDTPLLARARGNVQFTDTGFSLAGVQAQALGGEVRIEGGMRGGQEGAGVQLRVQGTASAVGLQQARELGLLSALAGRATGSAPYSLVLNVRRGVPEVLLTTELQGMALDLPAPLAKAADSSLTVKFENQLTPASLARTADAGALQDRLSVEVGSLAALTYLRQLGNAEPEVLRGSIAMGMPAGQVQNLPESGVEANLRLGDLDLDAWQAALAAPAGATNAAGLAGATSAVPGALQRYLPDIFALQATSLRMGGRSLHGLVVGGSREGSVWRANLDAQELAGYLEYRQATSDKQSAGGLFARLSRLSVPESAATQIDALLDEQPASLPALDIIADAFELRGRKLGRLEIDARNRGAEGAQREWRLAKFNLSTPDAVFTASGNWTQVQAVGAQPGKGGGAAPQRRTVLGFALDMRDAGALLARFGMQDVVRRGRGRMEGQIAWLGAPISPDYRSMTGQIHLDVGAGQFLKAEPGLAKLLSVLSLQSLPRRFALDFRDLFSQGFAFDFVRGDVRIENGVATTNNLQMKGVNAAVLMEGSADIERETQDLHVVVVPEINALTASLVATAINPVIGLGSFLAQVFLRGPLIAAATQEFSVRGTWSDPEVTKLPRRLLRGPPDPPPAPAPLAPAADASEAKP